MMSLLICVNRRLASSPDRHCAVFCTIRYAMLLSPKHNKQNEQSLALFFLVALHSSQITSVPL